MKKSAISTLTTSALFFGATFASAEDYYKSNTSNWNDTFVLKDYNIYYDGSAGGEVRIGGGSYDVLSTIYKNTEKKPSLWYTGGHFTYHVDATEGEDIVFKNETGSLFQALTGPWTVKKAEGNESSTAVAVIDGGAAQLRFCTGGGSSNPNLYIQTDTIFKTSLPVTSAITPLYIGNNAGVYISNNSKFTTQGKVYFQGTDGKLATLSVEEGSTYQAGSLTIFGDKFVSDIEGTLRASGDIEVREGSTLNVGTFIHDSGKVVKVTGVMSIKNLGDTGFAATTVNGANASISHTTVDAKTLISRNFNILNGATLTTAGHIYIKGLDWNFNNTNGAAYATLTIGEGGHIYVNDSTLPRVILDNGTIIFNQENAITTSDGKFVHFVTTLKDGDGLDDAKLYINKSQTFRNIRANGADIDIYLSMTDIATLSSQEYFEVSEGAFIIIHNFQNDRILVNEMKKDGSIVSDANEIFKAYQTINGEEVMVQNLAVVNGMLTSIAVPEPAEWAMIFGAIALGLAIYRRRK